MLPRDDTLPHASVLALLFALPALHPILIPVVGAPSHLLWWVHVLPVALLTFHRGRRAAVGAVILSATLVGLGEATFGRGYGVPALPETVLLLSGAVAATNLLVVWFALHARKVGARYRTLMENVRMGVLQVGPAGTVRAANLKARSLLAPHGDRLEGRQLEEVVSVPGCESVEDLAGRGGWTGTLELHAEEGCRAVPVFLVAVADSENGGYQLLVLDRSLEVAHEQEIERQAKLAALGEALAGVAHELNNPLTTILAHAQLAAMGAGNGSMSAESGREPDLEAETFEVIEHEATRMRDLIQELLGFSRTTSGDASVELGPLVERLVRVRRMALPDSVILEERVEWTGRVLGTDAKVEQIVLNLVSNAAWELETTGGGRILLTVTRAGPVAKVEVRDDGPGLAAEMVDRVFDPFVTTKPEGEGTGLGLAIARRLARSWGGDLRARNHEDGGAVFTLLLPVVEPGSDDSSPATGAGERRRPSGSLVGSGPAP